MGPVAGRQPQMQSWVGEIRSRGAITTVTLMFYGEALLTVALQAPSFGTWLAWGRISPATFNRMKRTASLERGQTRATGRCTAADNSRRQFTTRGQHAEDAYRDDMTGPRSRWRWIHPRKHHRRPGVRLRRRL
jgi:hypothetical protein